MPTPDFDADFEWQKRYLPQTAAILGRTFIKPASFEDDTQRAIDLKAEGLHLLHIPRDLAVACRFRTAEKYWPRYRADFTVRYSRSNGSGTEYFKIFKLGYVEVMFYGFGDHDGRIVAYRIINLKVCRALVANGIWQPRIQPNHDGKTTFAIFDFRDAPPWWGPVLIAARPRL